MIKKSLALILGGQSAEHDISILSAYNIYKALDAATYDVTLIGIERKSGRWVLLDKELFSEIGGKIGSSERLFARARSVFLAPSSDDEATVISLEDCRPLFTIDLAFPVLHGPNGEDGTVQGLLRMLGIAFVGCDVAGSAIGMDKDIAKRLLRDAGLNVAKFETATPNNCPLYKDVSVRLGALLFVKPARMGSSVGVNKVVDQASYEAAVKEAFSFDHKIIIEEAVNKAREVEVSVIGNLDPEASIPGEIVTNFSSHNFYSYQAKYLDNQGARTQIPLNVSNSLRSLISHDALKVYTTLGLDGMARVDFFLTPDEKVIVNEVNTIPGFTDISMYPMLWKESGLEISQLLNRLITDALERHRRKKMLSSKA
jgi:D-alanine-D-alanine ligase